MRTFVCDIFSKARGCGLVSTFKIPSDYKRKIKCPGCGKSVTLEEIDPSDRSAQM